MQATGLGVESLLDGEVYYGRPKLIRVSKSFTTTLRGFVNSFGTMELQRRASIYSAEQ
jgi:hypothetical protein